MNLWSKATLQWRLTFSLLLTTGLVWLAVLVMTWVETEHELSELLDAHLAQTAALLAAKTGDGHADDFTTTPILHKYQPRVAFQIWHENQLMVQSAQAPAVALAALGSEGVSDFVHEKAAWRVFATRGNAADVWVVVAELHSARDDILDAGLRSALGPVLLGLPVLALLIWWVVFHALSPLRSLSQTVSQRHPQSLEPLPAETVSVEVQPLVQALNRLFEKMAVQMESERRFNADAAHELRTPIAAIRMHAQVAQGAQRHEERQDALNAVLQGCDRATRLVAQLLQMSRLSADTAHEPQAFLRSGCGNAQHTGRTGTPCPSQSADLESAGPRHPGLAHAARFGVCFGGQPGGQCPALQPRRRSHPGSMAGIARTHLAGARRWPGHV